MIFQDNQSTMRLAVNGSLSSSKRTKHIKARYYFIKDKIKEGEVDVRYCPTTEMWSDVLNKPKHVTQFKKDRAKLMNVPLAYDDDLEFKNTHPVLLTKEVSLGAIERQRSNAPSRSVLGDIENSPRAGILANGGSSGNTIKWSDIA